MLNRVVDGEDAPGEWQSFTLAADRAPTLWRELAVHQREARLLDGALGRRVRDAGIAVAFEPTANTREMQSTGEFARGPRPMHFASPRSALRFGWTGWALAACLAGAWVVSNSISFPDRGARLDRGLGHAAGADGSRAAGTGSGDIVRASLSPDEALRAYLDLGRESGSVVGELPGKPVIERRAAEDGNGFDVVYVRQIIERRRVPTLYEFGQSDEFGRAVAAPIPVRTGTADTL